MNATLRPFIVLVSLLLLGADCQKTEQACIDFSGYELEVAVTNPESVSSDSTARASRSHP